MAVSTLSELAVFAGSVLAAIVAAIGASTYLASRFRKAADHEKDRYIGALEKRRDDLEVQVQDWEHRSSEMRDKIGRLEERLLVLQDLVLMRCRNLEVDPETGGCRYCTRGLYYGHSERPETTRGV